MGCVSSKAFKKDLSRDIVVFNNGGHCTDHVVSLTSSTYGLLNLDKEVSISETEIQKPQNSQKQRASPPRIEPEVINAWELMEDLEEGGPINGKTEKSPKARIFLRGFADLDVKSPMKLLTQIGSPRKLRKSGGKENQFSPRDSVLKPSPAANIFPPAKDTPVGSKRESFTANGTVPSAKRSFSPLFQEEQIKKMASPSPRTRKQRKAKEHADSILSQFPILCPPGGEAAVVIYTTTLRGIRKTFEDCNKTRSIFESHDVLVFERDISMDSGFKEELRKLIGAPVAIPAVFVKGRFVGGAEEVGRLEEEGKMGILVEGIEKAVVGCGGCGGFRFVMCRECDGSCKVMSLVEKKMERCGGCNENGLVQCSVCCCFD